MAKKHYDWADGPAELESHSLTKHAVLVEYLKLYFEYRTRNAPGREVFRITLVDGFSGGGLFKLKGTGKEVLGSPLRMLKAVEEVSFLINQKRVKKIDFQVQYVFVDNDAQAIEHLRKVLQEQGYGSRIGTEIHLITQDFDKSADHVMHLVRSHTPRTAKALFFLDQYGYTEVPAPLIRKILSGTNSNEVVLTFHVASFATYTNSDLTSKIQNTLQIDIQACLGGKSIEEIKSSDADWRRFIQGALYQALVTECGARYFTPFFIRGEGSGHGEYWLVHLSQHHRAQDVMKQVHWGFQNHFMHYGRAGLDMLAPHTMGFMQEFDGGFRFDDVAKSESMKALKEDLGTRIFSFSEPKTFGQIYAETCNGSPGTAEMYKGAIEILAAEKDIVITAADGRPKRLARYITDTDVVRRSEQIKLFRA